MSGSWDVESERKRGLRRRGEDAAGESRRDKRLDLLRGLTIGECAGDDINDSRRSLDGVAVPSSPTDKPLKRRLRRGDEEAAPSSSFGGESPSASFELLELIGRPFLTAVPSLSKGSKRECSADDRRLCLGGDNEAKLVESSSLGCERS